MPRGVRVWTLLCLLLLYHAAASNGALFPVRRQEGEDVPPSPSPPPSPSSSPAQTLSESQGDQRSRTSGSPPSSLESSANLLTTSDTRSTDLTPSAAPTSDIGSKTEEDIPDNVNIPEGELPLQPQITPGWGVAGVLMICTGIVYALVGIKTARIHAFFSTAILTSLGTAVLVLYVTEIPVSLAVQGGYVAAAMFTGIMLGGVATFFKELTASFGCLLGGFCLSMWLLCLKPGGLLPQTTTRIIFITCLTMGAFALYFVRYVRPYALIASISFSGATVTVLGIDCFSRAGLKEFWAYLWDLNQDLFPLGTKTYPVTRGIRVETAVIVVISAAGVFSQFRLWRVINPRRIQRDAERAQQQRDLAEEEENVGRRVQAQTDQEKQLWEKRYGGGTQPGANSSGSVLLSPCQTGERRNGSIHSRGSGGPQSSIKAETAQGKEALPSSRGTPRVSSDGVPGALMASGNDKDGVVTVRVAADDTLPAMRPGIANPNPEELGPRGQSLDQARGRDQEPTAGDVPPASPQKAHSLQEKVVAHPPPVVPLPFKVPTRNEDMGTEAEEDRSSVATFASREYDDPLVADKRQSIAEGISEHARDVPGRVSQRISHSMNREPGTSQDQLAILLTRSSRDVDDRSVAATMDVESLWGVEDSPSSLSRRITSDLGVDLVPQQAADQEADSGVAPQSAAVPQAEIQLQQAPMPSDEDAKDLSTAKSAAAKAHLNMPNTSETVLPEGTRADDESPKRADAGTAANVSLKRPMPPEPSIPGPRNPKSVTSVESTPVSLTRDRLPHALSRVAMSYRTNEWAKHLSHADLPEPERIQLGHLEQPHPVEGTADRKGAEGVKEETPAPLDVDDLQQTAKTCASVAQLPTQNDPKARPSSTVGAKPSLRGQGPITLARNASSGATTRVERPGTWKSICSTTWPLSGEQAGQAIGNSGESGPPYLAEAAAGPENSAKRFSDHTLIGQREMLLRSRSNLYPPGSATMPNLYPPAARAPSEAGSVYNQPMHSMSGPLPAVMADDDMPLSQRKEMIRRHSLLRNSNSFASRPTSGVMYFNLEGEAVMSTDHLPLGRPHPCVPSLPTRDFHQPSVFRPPDPRSGTPVPFLGGFEQRPARVSSREHEVQRSMDAQRRALMGLKDAEAQRRERESLVREIDNRAFTARMQSGDLLEAHRDTLRRMQKQANPNQT
ncbi:hypothetical protein SODALDRAFT_171176 [Sodiomyces alkalinus F11]|uniref:TM7S3/TM198-like domain-containing protein n=1 Tax=Sodiomyces alkalinus (strain CBS 110278 / VKM F-3762 / F11) TaxID=1314773 RepID=A0A3N2PWB4_SODAK|nr:hypothetical protein SODALDRAFT_171176 [Sodiomyces alkalinus F11]ROT38801.1 hypothetical protein SODALDRAFT_171176 [Sodiomyces alkalinus F11]